MKFLLRAAESFLFILPFQVALSPVPGVDLPISRVFALLLIAAYVAMILSRREAYVPLTAAALFLGSFLFLSLLSVLWAQNVSWAVRRASFSLSFFPLFLPYVTLIKGIPDAAKRLTRSFVIGAGLAAVLAISQFLCQFIFGVEAMYRIWVTSVLPVVLGPSFSASVAEYPSLLVNVGGKTLLRATAFFPDPHMAAYYFGMALPFAIWFFLEAGLTRSKWFFAAIAVAVSAADLLTFSRGGYVGLVFGAVVFVSRYASAGRNRGRMISLVFGVLPAILVLVLSVSPVRDRLYSTFSLDDGSNRGRMELYAQALRNIGRQPFGYGLGNYPIVVKPTAEYREPIYAHDLFLDIATESGVLGSVCFLFALSAAFRALLRSRKGLAIAGTVSLAVFFGHSLFETPIYSVHVLPILLLLLALPPSDGSSRSENPIRV